MDFEVFFRQIHMLSEKCLHLRALRSLSGSCVQIDIQDESVPDSTQGLQGDGSQVEELEKDQKSCDL